MALKHHKCPACHEDGLGFRSRFVSGMLWPGECDRCGAKVRPHPGWAMAHILASNLVLFGAIIGFIVLAQADAGSGALVFSVIVAIIVLAVASYLCIPMTKVERKT